MATLTPIAFSIVVSLAPALSMLFGSIVLQKFEVTPHTMAIFQARSCEVGAQTVEPRFCSPPSRHAS